MRYRLLHLDKVFDVNVRVEKEEYIVTVNEEKYRVKDFAAQCNHVSMKIQDKNFAMSFAQDGDKRYVSHDGEYYIIEIVRPAKSGVRAAQQEANSVASSMPGLLIKMPVRVGEEVSVGQTLAIVEAMKMQNELHAPCDGVVKKINFKEGDQVDAFQPIVELESSEK